MAAPVVMSRRLALANSKWRVFLDRIVDHGGNEVADYLVIEGREPRRDNITGVAILPILDGHCVLLRSFRYALGTESFEVPRGFVDPGEEPRDAALRELTEETGLTCPPEDLVPLGCYAPEPSTLRARGALFAATRCAGTLRAADDEIGIAAVAVMDADHVARLIACGEIEDAATLVVFYRYEQLLRTGLTDGSQRR
jgi:8-oxo-dGTP pyrophosphatase MutT (NUDIX family)